MKPAGISVIIPSYNQGRFLRKAIESALSQAYRPIEVLIMDGASSDESVEILHSYDRDPCVRWVSEPDRGPADAVNKGLRMASYEMGTITSADDFYLPGAFAESMVIFDRHPEVNLVYGEYVKTLETGADVHVVSGRYSRGNLLCRLASVPQGSAFFRIDAARRLGGWNEAVPFVSDTDLWFRLALTGQVLKVDRFWSGSHTHPGQRTHQRENVLRDYTRMIEGMAELRDAEPWLRRAAQAGLYFARNQYGADASDWVLTVNTWKALLLYPGCVASENFQIQRLVPGYFRLAGWGGAVKRLLGLRTSTGGRS